MADFTKTGIVVDDWSQIAVNAIKKGTEIAIPDDLMIALGHVICHDSVNAHANGVAFVIEVSQETSGDENWRELLTLQSSGGTANKTDVDVECAAAATQLKVALTANFQTKMDRYFIKNAVVANSEVVRNNGYATDDYITILDGLGNTQEITADVFDIVEDWVITIPAQYRRARILDHNDDADCTICVYTEIAKVTDLV